MEAESVLGAQLSGVKVKVCTLNEPVILMKDSTGEWKHSVNGVINLRMFHPMYRYYGI